MTKAIVLRQYASGDTLHRLDLGGIEQRYGGPIITVHRAILRQALHDRAVELGVDLRFGTTVHVKESDFDKGVLSINDSESFRADLFLGADGANSCLRKLVTGLETNIVPHGHIVHRIVIDESLMLRSPTVRHLAQNPNITVWLGPESQAVTYSLDGLFNIAFTRPWWKEPFYTPQAADLPVFQAELKEEGWDPVLQEVIGLATACHRWMFVEPRIDGEETPWVHPSNKLCLVGDSAHQTLPYL